MFWPFLGLPCATPEGTGVQDSLGAPQAPWDPPARELAADFSTQSLFSKHPTGPFNYFLINSSFSKHLDYCSYIHTIYKNVNPPEKL